MNAVMHRNGLEGSARDRRVRTPPRRRPAPAGAAKWLAGLGALVAAALTGGCATYHALPLARAANLAPRLSELHSAVAPARAGVPARRIDLDEPLSIDDIGLLAVLNDPALRAERGAHALAQAAVLQASLLPNPSASFSFEAFVGGIGTSGWAASLTEDLRAILTYHSRVKSAHFALGEVNADLLWRQWQVAQQARVLALGLYWEGRSIGLARREVELLHREVRAVRSATAVHVLGLAVLAPLLSAQASAEQFLATAHLTQQQGWQTLDALLGLTPGVRFAIAAPELPPVPSSLERLIARLPERRPDLMALRLGYRSADENVRTAIIGQFPAFSLGGIWEDDNGNVRNAGPLANFTVPLFDRNQGQIAAARATRRLLHEQYQSRLDQAVGTAEALVARIHRLDRDVGRARREARLARSFSRAARRAYSQDNLDSRALVDYETTALKRRIEANTLELSRGEARIALTVDLGLGLPRARITLPAHPRTLAE